MKVSLFTITGYSLSSWECGLFINNREIKLVFLIDILNPQMFSVLMEKSDKA